MNTRTGRRSLALLAAALLAACATVPAPTQAPASAPPSTSNLSLLFSSSLSTSTPPVTSDRHFLPLGPATIERDYIDRYACVTGLPLMCQCFSRLGSTCECRC